MTPNEFLGLWESSHGKLASGARSRFLKAVELPEILSFEDESISRRIPNQRYLKNLLEALEYNGTRAERPSQRDAEVRLRRADSDLGGECIHGLAAPDCHYCKPPPAGIPRTVYITYGGNRFHKEFAGPSLDEGQSDADVRGDQVHDRRAVGWAEVSETRSPCKTCFPRLRT